MKLQTVQGMGALWKGVSSVLLVKGMVIVAESTINETTSLQK